MEKLVVVLFLASFFFFSFVKNWGLGEGQVPPIISFSFSVFLIFFVIIDKEI